MTDPQRLIELAPTLECLARVAETVCRSGAGDCIEEWLNEAAKDCREHDPSVGIFANDEMAECFSLLATLVDHTRPNGTTLAAALRALVSKEQADGQ